MKNIVIYCGSHYGADSEYPSFAGRLGEALGKGGYRMVYGGGSIGLMGIAADSAMSAGSHVTGIIPEVFISREQAHRGITELIEVKDMEERKKKMIDMGDAFIILPGGIGTMEELMDTFSHYKIYSAPSDRPPIIIMNLGGIYDPLKDLFRNLLAQGFMEEEDITPIHFCTTLEEVMEIISCSQQR